MQAISTTDAQAAPFTSPEALQRSRIAARVGVSPSIAGVLAGLAWGADRRDHGMMLAGLTAERVGGRAHG